MSAYCCCSWYLGCSRKGVPTDQLPSCSQPPPSACWRGLRLQGAGMSVLPRACVHPRQIATAPGLGLNFAPHSEQVPGMGRGQTTRAGTFRPAGVEGVPRSPKVQRCPGPQPWLRSHSCIQEGRIPAPPTWKGAGLQPFPCSHRIPGVHTHDLTSSTAVSLVAAATPDGINPAVLINFNKISKQLNFFSCLLLTDA